MPYGPSSRPFVPDGFYEDYSIELQTCCNPSPGNVIVAAVEDGIVKVHTASCWNAPHFKLVDVYWSTENKKIFVISVKGADRVGFLADVSKTITASGLSVSSHSGITDSTLGVHVNFTFPATERSQVEGLVGAIRAIPGVSDVTCSALLGYDPD